jgi:hypothetical protein
MADVSPTTAELAAAVQAHLDDQVLPGLDGRAGYELRIASNLLAIVRREAELGAAAAARERERLVELVGEGASAGELNARLADRIRAGGTAVNDAALLRHLRETALDRLAIDNPRYSAYLRARRPRDGDR